MVVDMLVIKEGMVEATGLVVLVVMLKIFVNGSSRILAFSEKSLSSRSISSVARRSRMSSGLV